jgi:hypothetical protein
MDGKVEGEVWIKIKKKKMANERYLKSCVRKMQTQSLVSVRVTVIAMDIVSVST